MDKKKKQFHVKEINSEEKTVTGHVSTFEWDRDGERFVKGAWELDNFRRNPVVLWAHNHTEPPIGKAGELREDDKGLLAKTRFDEKGEKSMQVFSLFERGFLNSFSVGFLRKGFVMEDMGGGEKGLAITKAELYEYSAVSVPANPGATVQREVADLAIKTLGQDAIEVIHSKSMGDQYLVLPVNGQGGFTAPPDHNGLAIPYGNFEPALKQIINMARIAKGDEFGDQKKTLLTTAISVFNEILEESDKDQVNKKLLQDLYGSVEAFGDVIQAIYPANKQVVQKTISQMRKALEGQAG